MRIIIIRVIIMSCGSCKYKELILKKKDIDFSSKTVERLNKTVSRKIECFAQMMCEPCESFRWALESGDVLIGGTQSTCGEKFIFLSYQNQNFVVPYIDLH